MPHRIVLLVCFFPTLVMLLSSPDIKLIPSDWLIIGSSVWAALALIVNHSVSSTIEPIGIHMIEFLGAYMLGRTAIRTAEDFQTFVKAFLLLLIILLPFAALESLTKRPVLLDLIPQSIAATDTGERLGMRRAQTAFAHPILFGAFASSALGLFWYIIAPERTRALTAPLVAALTVFSLSTGAFISFVMQVIFIAWETIAHTIRRRWTYFGVGAIVAYFLIDLLSNRTPFHVLVTYASFNSGSAYNRILIWQYGTDNVWANPVFGLGLNAWVRPSWMSSSMDNFWLVIATQYGLPAIALFIAGVVTIIRSVALRDFIEEPIRRCQAGFLVSVGGIVIAGGTVHYWHGIMAFALFFFGSGGWIAKIDERSEDGAVETPLQSPERKLTYTRFPSKKPLAKD
jgi:hypothetical protein